MKFFSKNILITGANGYIGSSVAKKLSTFDCNLFLLSRTGNVPSFVSKLRAKIKIIKADITKKNVWTPFLKHINIVFHFAAQTSSQFANNNPYEDLKTNLLSIVNLIETCQKNNFSPDIIFAGTVTEVGFTEKGKINEEHKDSPITIYDIHKLTAEKYLQYYSNQLKRRATTLRLPNIYGPGPTSSKPDRGIVNLMIKKALNDEPITIFGDGSYIRDYLYIKDVVAAFIKAAEHIEKTKENYYVLGTGIGHTILQMAQIIKEEVEKLAKKKVTILFSPFPQNTSRIEYRNFIADSSKFREDTGWSATISLEEGIERTVDYFST